MEDQLFIDPVECKPESQPAPAGQKKHIRDHPQGRKRVHDTQHEVERGNIRQEKESGVLTEQQVGDHGQEQEHEYQSLRFPRAHRGFPQQ